jgi:succinoglycan biosynthesis transport protein ExoP
MEEAGGPGRYYIEEEIDLREYIGVLIKHWKLIALTTFLAALSAGVVSFLTPPTYEATAGVVVLKSEMEITFDPKIRTLTEEDLGVNLEARRKAFAGLVKNGAIASQVIEELGDKLEEGEKEPARLLGMVEGEVEGSSDLIQITVTANDSLKAADIANAWGRAYEQHVNAIYSGVPESYASVQSEVKGAKDEYRQVEEALTAFIADSRIDNLHRLITETQRIVNSLQSARELAVTTVVDEGVEDRMQTLADYYATKRKMEQLLEDAKALRVQVQEGGEDGAATNSLALLMLKAESFSTSADLPGELQLQLEMGSGVNTGASAQQADAEALIAVLEDRIAGLEKAIEEESAALLGSEMLLQLEELETLPSYTAAAVPLTQAIDEMQEKLQSLQADLEKEKATKQELTCARDLAWETYTTLARKEAELGIATRTGGTEVRFATPAVPPTAPAGPKKKRNIAIAGAMGLMVGVFGAFALNYLAPGYASGAVINGCVGKVGPLFGRKEPRGEG